MPLKLSKRLKQLSIHLQKGTRFADIGSDHAYLPCYVCLHDRTATAVAGEIAEGPYKRAKQTVQQYGLNNQVEVRLGDGLNILSETDRINEIVIAGMGGTTITNILNEGKDQLKNIQTLILQPNNKAYKVRKFLFNNNFTLKNEYILEENNLFYEILLAVPSVHSKGPEVYDNHQLERQLYFGPYLLKENSETFKRKWREEAEKLRKIITQMKSSEHSSQKRLNTFEQQLQWMEEFINE